MVQIKNLLDEEIADNQTILVVGPSGTKKTIGIIGNPEPLFIVAADPGKRSGLDPIWPELLNNKANFVFRASPRDGMYDQLMNAIHHTHDKFQTIIPGDSITYLQAAILEEIMTHGIGKAKARPTFDEWGLVQERTRNVLMTAMDTGLNVYATCLEQLIKEEITGSVTGLPLVYGRMAYDLSAMFRTVVHLTAKPKTKGHPEVIARAAPDHMWRFPKDSKGILQVDEPHPQWLAKMYPQHDISSKLQRFVGM